ncbi:MAG: hypothetical protein KGJ62_08790 [Armatimonadetes bacterium]|nr:hypothetical protein [Armatimonadota bacterium]
MSLTASQPAVEPATARASPGEAPPVRGKLSGLTFRSLTLGLILTALTDLWIHWAELVLGDRGHTALANTSIPVGAFDVMLLLVAVNVLLTRFLRRFAFSPAEILVIYAMLAVSTVISSSGGIHFVVPTITAAFYYADSSNNWLHQFGQYVPNWIALKDHAALRGFYSGNASVPWMQWRMQMTAWVGFLVVLAFASLCIVVILRRHWIDRERLAFPTACVPVAVMKDNGDLMRSRLMWLGFAIACGVDVMNTIHLNMPTVPYFPTRTADQPDIQNLFAGPPWNAIGFTPISFYPFVLGIAYLLSLETTFSCWFFWLVQKLELVYGAASGISAGATSGGLSQWPYTGHQGAGAFLALTVAGMWLARGYLREVWRMAFHRRVRGAPAPDRNEPVSYRAAFLGLGLCLVLLVAWCMAAGMRGWVAATLIGLAFMYIVAAARIRAETGNAWLFGPQVDAYHALTSFSGSLVYTPAELTAMAYVRNAVASFDLRCLTMPNQFDAYKMADDMRVNKRRLTVALSLAIGIGIAVSFAIALVIWYRFGAGAKTEQWRTSMGRLPFDQLSSVLSSPIRPDIRGNYAVAAGFLITSALMVARMRIDGWMLSPVGYAMANTPTMNQVWLPFFLAWLSKALILKFGGMRGYRASLPFFYGLILGDFVAGGATTLIGCFTGINVYPINW